MNLPNGGHLYVEARDYMQSKAVDDGAFWGAAGALAGDKILRVGGKFITRLSSKGFNAAAFADEIVAINKTTDGGGALLNGVPSSAINSAMYYETAAEQGASIFRSIAGGHIFVNGNKRTAVAAFQSFAKQHGLKTVGHQQLMDAATQVATGQVREVSEIAKMLLK